MVFNNTTVFTGNQIFTINLKNEIGGCFGEFRGQRDILCAVAKNRGNIILIPM